jgi:Sulfatase
MMRIRKLLGALVLSATTCLTAGAVACARDQAPAKPNILVIFGDDVGQTNISAYSSGVVGYKTPKIDRLAKEGMMFTDARWHSGRARGRGHPASA